MVNFDFSKHMKETVKLAEELYKDDRPKENTFPKSRKVKGVATINWICRSCSNGNDDSLTMLKANEMVSACNYCTVTSLVEPEWMA